MEIQETAAVLAKIQSFDNRNVDNPNIMAWHEVLAPYTLNDCLKAVSQYFAKSADWIMPAHVVERVRAIEECRRNKFHSGVYPTQNDEQSGNWIEVTRRLNRAVATGTLTPAAYQRYHDQNLTLGAALGLVAIQ
ncbi:hypothetical protein AL755_08585 [Arthrobacter sp. ERGS1:01]|uniref:hypothetical protein n=1 Tax=Arthrobacter sp. ERGS1:01 TaxID=1704044 RepID=UPI0006B62044|nr:hypothetical protein [Arthrobacter sp. ERGS1:01]ALE05524.1 hypothetical protein AL755_08585 [Arthrobacter sp. ERGS1:01]